jgi:hypothetical protein
MKNQNRIFLHAMNKHVTKNHNCQNILKKILKNDLANFRSLNILQGDF